jgi:hypothetical protein
MTELVNGTVDLNFSYFVECSMCSETYELKMNYYDYVKWCKRLTTVQTIFPYIPAAERELLITGICPSCWNSMFVGEDSELTGSH